MHYYQSGKQNNFKPHPSRARQYSQPTNYWKKCCNFKLNFSYYLVCDGQVLNSFIHYTYVGFRWSTKNPDVWDKGWPVAVFHSRYCPSPAHLPKSKCQHTCKQNFQYGLVIPLAAFALFIFWIFHLNLSWRESFTSCWLTVLKSAIHHQFQLLEIMFTFTFWKMGRRGQ